MKRIADGIYQLTLRIVNVFLLEMPDGLVLVDTGVRGSESAILAAMKELGHAPGALKHIVVTHAHPDHAGGLAALVRATGATTWMRVEDAPIVERGDGMRPIYPSPGLIPKLLFAAMSGIDRTWEGAKIDRRIEQDGPLPFGPLEAIHMPGHCAGQIALLSPDRRVLLAADTCMNVISLRAPFVNEDVALSRRSLARLAGFTFETAGFGHGRPIIGGADARFRKAFGQAA